MGSPSRSYDILGLRSDTYSSSFSRKTNSPQRFCALDEPEDVDGVKIMSNKVWVSSDPIDESIFDKLTTTIKDPQVPKVVPTSPEPSENSSLTDLTMLEASRQRAGDSYQAKPSIEKHVAHVAYVTNVSVASVCLCCTGQQARRCSLNVGELQLYTEDALFLEPTLEMTVCMQGWSLTSYTLLIS